MRFPLALLVLATFLHAQSITAPTTPVLAGSSVTVTLNTGPGFPSVFIGPDIFLLHPEGALIAPQYAIYNDALSLYPANVNLSRQVAVPAIGPGSSGSFVLYFPLVAGAVARLDVGAADPLFPRIHSFPSDIHTGFRTHVANFGTMPSGSPTSWTLANPSVTPHTFGAGDSIQILNADGTSALASQSLNGLNVPAGGVLRVNLPLTGLTAGPHLVQTTWSDPVAGPIVRRTGIHTQTARGELHLPGGKQVPLGGSLPAFVALRSQSGFAPTYALAIGFQPGNTTLPGGVVLPLALDSLVLESLNSGLFGLLTNHIATPTFSPVTCFCPIGFGWISTVIDIAHPGNPALSGLQFRVAAATFDPIANLYGSTQPELITLQ